MAKKKKSEPSPEKSAKILKDGMIRGIPLTEAQIAFFRGVVVRAKKRRR